MKSLHHPAVVALLFVASIITIRVSSFTTTTRVSTFTVRTIPQQQWNRRLLPPPPSTRPTAGHFMTKEEDTARTLLQKAQRMKLEAEALQAKLTLEKIDTLERALTSSKPNKNKNDIATQIQTLAQTVDPSLVVPSLSKLNNDTTNNSKNRKEPLLMTIDSDNEQQQQLVLEEETLQEATKYYCTLPQPLKRALATVIGMDYENIPPSVIVLSLYKNMKTLDFESLQGLYQQQLQSPIRTAIDKEEEEPTVSSPVLQWPFSSSDTDTTNDDTTKNDDSSEKASVLNQIVNVMDKDSEVNALVESLLPSVTRNKPNVSPTLQDLDCLVGVLNKNTFQMVEEPQAIPGGFVIRGNISNQMKKTSVHEGLKLIQTLDDKLNQVDPEWTRKFQVCYTYDPTPRSLDDTNDANANPVLLVTSNDLTPTTNRFLLSGITFLSFFLIVLYGISTFGANDVIMERLKEASTAAASSENTDVTWFNQLLYPVLLPLGVSQACHEAGHLYMARQGGFKTTPPTVLPLIALPYLTFQTKLKSSPADMNSLFTFAAIGPALGMLVSAVFFTVGLDATVHMDANALAVAPSVPVAFLKLSSLGGTIVDYILSGQSTIGAESGGILLSQDPSTPIALHPYVIGGMAAFMIQCLDVIPLGATDGGRMSLSLLGRKEHVALSSFVYGALFLYAVLGGHETLFLTYVVVNGVVQKDVEVPCRNEAENANLPRATVALLMWCIAILALTPIG